MVNVHIVKTDFFTCREAATATEEEEVTRITYDGGYAYYMTASVEVFTHT